MSVLAFFIVHNHFRPGGVRRVIELAAPAIVRHLPDSANRIVMVGGESPESCWREHFESLLRPVHVSWRMSRFLRYVAEQDAEPVTIQNGIRCFLDRLLAANSPKGTSIIWAHNQGLGRNLILSGELLRVCKRADVSLILHHHDWWFDNRWQRWDQMRQSGCKSLREIARIVFACEESVRHITINGADAAVLSRRLGCLAAWIPNPLAVEDEKPKGKGSKKAKGSKARGFLEGRLGVKGPVWLMPCRLLRRKNIAEALLLTRWLRPEAWLVTTGGVSSQEERAYQARLERHARSGGAQMRLGVLAPGPGSSLSVSDLMAESEVVLLTSLQEGFGLAYFEAPRAMRPLLARALPNVMPDLRHFGLHLPYTYDEVMVDPSLFEWGEERERQTRLYSQWNLQLPRYCQALVGKPWLLQVGLRPKPIPFSRLTLTGQLEVLSCSPSESWRACVGLNPWLAKWREAAASSTLAVAAVPKAADKQLGAEAYAKRFCRFLNAGPTVPPRKDMATKIQDDFFRVKLSSANLYPLTWTQDT